MTAYMMHRLIYNLIRSQVLYWSAATPVYFAAGIHGWIPYAVLAAVIAISSLWRMA